MNQNITLRMYMDIKMRQNKKVKNMDNEHKLNIHQRMHAVMGDLKYIQKGDKTVNGQYAFVSHDQVTGALQPLLVKHRILAIPDVVELHKDSVTIAIWDKKENRKVEKPANLTRMKIVVTFYNIDDPKDFVQKTSWGEGLDDSDKGAGKAESYAYKYALLKSFCIATGDDPDNEVNQIIDKATTSDLLNEGQVGYIMQELRGDEELKNNILKSYKVNKIEEINSSQYNYIVDQLKKIAQSKRKTGVA